MPHTHLHLYVSLTRSTTGPSLGTLKESKVVSDVGGRWMEQCPHSVCQLEMLLRDVGTVNSSAGWIHK